jgi:hypothetical protein
MCVRAVCPALTWFGILGPEQVGRVRAAIVVADHSRQAGRPTSAARPVIGSRTGLVAVVAPPRSRRETHLVVLGIWEEEPFWVAGGYECKRRVPEDWQLRDGDRIASAWIRGKGRNQ